MAVELDVESAYAPTRRPRMEDPASPLAKRSEPTISGASPPTDVERKAVELDVESAYAPRRRPRMENPASPLAMQPEPVGFGGAAVRGFKRSLPETKSLLYGAVGAGGGLVGADSVRDWGLENYQRVKREEIDPLQSDASFAGTVKGESSIGEYLGDTLGNLGGQALQSVAVAAAGAAAGTAAGGAAGVPVGGVGAAPGAVIGGVVGGVGGLVTRGVAKRALTNRVEKLITEQLAKGATREAAEVAGKKLAADTLRRTGGAALGVGALNIGKETGSIYADRAEDAQAAGEDLTASDAARAAAYGTVAGLVDTAAEGLNVGRFMGGASPSASAVRRIATGAAKGAVTEGGTEVAQTALERAGAGRSLTDEEALGEYLEAGAAGVIGGGVLGGAAGVRRMDPQATGDTEQQNARPRAQQEPPPEAVGTPAPSQASTAVDGSPIQDSSTGPHSRSVNNDAGSMPAQVPFPDAAPGSLADVGNTLATAGMTRNADSRIPDPFQGSISHGLNAGIDNGAAQVPFPEAAPSSLADAANTLAATTTPAAATASTAQAPGMLSNPIPATVESPTGGPWSDLAHVVEPTLSGARQSEPGALDRGRGTGELLDLRGSPGSIAKVTDQDSQINPPPAAGTVQVAAAEAATSPNNDLPDATPAQREAGNFKVGRAKINGHEISIEYPAGVKRKPDHKELTRAYGYIRRSEARDGEKVDVFLGEHADDTSLPVFVVDQVDAAGKYDEAKVIMGEATETAAREAYLSNYPEGWKGMGAITQMTHADFKGWIADSKKSRRPAGQIQPARAAAMQAATPAISETASGISLDRAHRLTQRLTRGWGADAPRVVLARSTEELRQVAGLPAGAEVGARAEGSYQGKPAVFLNVGAIENPQRFRQVLAHEALGHYGIERVVGGAEWSSIADAIGQHVRGRTGGKDVREAIDHLRRSQPEVLNDPNRAAREVLAVMAERGNRNGLIQRAVAGARRFLRQRMPDLKWSDTDVRDLLNQAEGVLRRRAPAGKLKPSGAAVVQPKPKRAAAANDPITPSVIADIPPVPVAAKRAGAAVVAPKPKPKRDATTAIKPTAVIDGQVEDSNTETAARALVDAYRYTDSPDQGTLFSKSADPDLTPAPDVSNVASEFEHLSDAQRAALGKIATFAPRTPLADRMRGHGERWRAKFVQGVFDQFAPLKDLDETAYMQARLSKGTDGAVEAAFRYGPPKLTDGALDTTADGKGLQGHLQELGGEHDLFFAWLAGNRAEALKAEDREHLFDDAEISALKQLGIGKMADGRVRSQVYGAAQRAFNRYQKHVLDIAEEAGILDPEARKLWTHDFYVPFYRVMEGEKAVSPGAAVTGLVRQKAFERLKGGTEPLGDLLANTLSNWSHLLSASMKNLAARHALDAASDMGVATPATGSDKGTVWVMVDGKQQHYTVSDPLVFDALTMLHHPGWNNPAMKAMRWFKRALTTGVTADPSFRIRNLMRDTMSSIAANRIGYNPLRNLVDGWRATERGGDTYLRLLGGGGAIRFGSLLDGDQATNAKRLIKAGIATEGQVLDTPAKAKAMFARAWDRWQELGDRAETVNRAVAYEQARGEGKSHLEASYAARDLLDFTMGGKWAAVRFLTQVVPFMNARLQGIYKLGRGAKEDPRRFATVTGAVAMSSVLLHLLNADDEEYKALPDWVRDTYWWVRVPGTEHALFIPKPFEIGALGSMAERGTELMTGGADYTARDFGGTLLSILNDQLAMNPVPQAFRPLMEAAFNHNSFQDRQIDGMGQERLPPADRYTARTSAGAIAVGKVVNVSPQRIEHMVRGYFGWLGSQALAVSDLAGRSLFDMPSNPAHDFSRPENLAVVGSFIRPAGGSGSKYVNRYFAQLKEVDQLYAAYSTARKAGDIERAAEVYQDDRLRLRGLYRAADKQMRGVNQQIRRVTSDRTLSAHEKQELLTGLYATRGRVAKWTTEEARRRQAPVDAR